ncbi:MAG: 4-oxalomesaconate tautomerase, partial [Proteobacteria bacterium]|nr:4-oxalomesaconate tautomerase [Pseudomonadota bacterium]
MPAFACSMIRGGSSRGAYFLADHLPADPVARNELLVRIMGGPDALQVDGIGGGHPLTSKVAIISRSAETDVDVDYLFLQIDPTRQTVSDAQNCGNLLAGVGLFAVDQGLVEAGPQSTLVRVRMLNTNALCHLDLLTPGGRFEPAGSASIDGVPGTGSPIVCNYLDIAGSSCGALLPTGARREMVAGIAVSCVDNGMPVVVMRAADFDLSGYETPEDL